MRIFFALMIFSALLGCSSVLYIPRIQNIKLHDPKQVMLTPEEIELEMPDKTTVSGWWFSSKQTESKGTFIFFHGNGENLTSHFLSLSWLPQEGYNYLIFDYPGYGVSEGEPTPEGTVEAGHAALRWVHEKKDPRPLIVYGQSLGGNIAYRTALDMQNEIPIKALILDSTFLSYRGIAREKMSEHLITWLLQPVAWLLMNDSFAPKDLQKRGPYPLLVTHGDADDIIPFSSGEEVFEDSAYPKEFWRVPGGKHGDLFWKHDKKYRKKLIDWLAELPTAKSPSDK